MLKRDSKPAFRAAVAILLSMARRFPTTIERLTTTNAHPIATRREYPERGRKMSILRFLVEEEEEEEKDDAEEEICLGTE